MLDVVLDGLVSLLSITVVLHYVIALRTHFSTPTVPTGTKVISALVVATTIIYLFLVWYFPQPVWPQVAGLVVEALSLALFWWTIFASREARLGLAFNTDAPDRIVTQGPYRYIRPPFYSCYLMFWAGWALATWSLWALIPLIGMVVVYTMAALGEERKFAGSDFGTAYAEYRRRAGLFWPKLV